MRSFRRTLQFLQPYKVRVLVAVILTLLVTVLQIVPPRLFQFTIDSPLKTAIDARKELDHQKSVAAKATNPTESQTLIQKATKKYDDDLAHSKTVLLILAIALVAIVAVRNALNYWLSYSLNWLGHRFCFDLRFATWRHLHRLSLAYHNQTQVGKIMSRVTADIELIQGLIQGQLVTFISDLVTLIAVMGMMFFLEWRMSLIIVALIPFYVIAYMAFLKYIREVSLEQRRLWDEMLGKLAEKIAGIGVVKAFVREDYETENFMSSVRAKFRVDMRQVHLNRRLGLVSGVISALGTGIVYAYGGNLVQQGIITTGILVAISFYIGYIFNPAVRVVDFNNTLQWAVAAMDRVFQTLDMRPEIEDKPDAIALPPVERTIVFDNVCFSYVDEKEAISNVTLKIKSGELIAIVGHSGCGKTTLMNLLMRFYDPSHGRILIDGHDLRDVRLETIRHQMSMVAQESVLFSVSIMENVKYGNRNATDEQAIDACKAADLHDFVMELPDGYETMIGEDGIKLSGGQKQRLALARALVTNPSILILDDVTSALDGETEARVQEALKHVMRGRTTFIIAHRLSSVVEADRIIVLEDGKIVDVGTHDELTQREGIYKELYEEQFRSALEQVRAQS